ncbi:PLP-dependent transferase [Patulibacter brassicae]|uniref:PLP-dependent transferase n=1 Tax=Patulibacter brassicae TaxID=1705717 RepID=A0ABU4VMJ3_9ACTN|nr:PLP-dependent transferase [Patulibacter brassicae]MDX8153056.1 PLP-dependent transferase [Patulibacter brassicae]
MSADERAGEGGSSPKDGGSAWAPGEAGVLPRGVAARARAELERQRGRGPRPAVAPDDAGAAPASGPEGLADATRIVRAGLPSAGQGRPFLPGPVFAAPYHAAGDLDEAPHVYGRMTNPGFERYEHALGELDGGHAVVFASGMAAVAAILHHLLGPGDLLVAPTDGYPGVAQLAREHLALRGVGVRLVPTADEQIRRAAKGASLVWLETPANPGLEVLELEETIAACRRAGARVVVDNTLATPLRQRPLELGADLVVSSDSKHLAGHSDLILGHVSAADEEVAAGLRSWRTLAGAVPGPFETWLAHRSLATLEVRLARQEQVAEALVAALRERDDVSDVRYPGLSSVVGFDLGSPRRARTFLSALEIVLEATSFGGLHTTAERRDRHGDGQVPPGYIRLSAGIEDPRDVVADVLTALDRSR